MSVRAFDRVRDAFIDAGCTVREQGTDKFRASAPGHSHNDDSVVVFATRDGVGMSSYTDDKGEIVAALGLTWADFYDNPRRGIEFRYPDKRVTRKPHPTRGKTFIQNTGPKGNSLYRTEFPDGAPVYIVEGEGNAEAVETAGAAATSCAGGGVSAAKADWSPLRGHEAIIVRDADTTGVKFVKGVTAQLDALDVAYRVVEAADGLHDVVDHLAWDHTLDELVPVESDPVDAEVIPINRKQKSPTEPPSDDPDRYPSPGEPYAVAARLLQDCWTDPESGLPTLIRWRDTWREWSGAAWPEAESAGINVRITHVLASKTCLDKAGRVIGWPVNAGTVGGVIAMLAVHTHLPESANSNERI